MDDFDLNAYNTEYFGDDFSSYDDSGYEDMQWAGNTELPWQEDFSSGLGDSFSFDGFDFGSVPEQQNMQWAMDTELDNPQWTNNQSGFNLGGIQDTLGKLFSNPQMLAKGLGAIFEGKQNKKYASKLNDAATRIQSISDPFASQRPQYQQLLSQTYTDPNVVLGRPEIAAQLQGMRQQMERRDAAAGRRSQYGDRENQLALQAAGLVDKYRQGLVPLTGANMQPNTAALAQLFQQAAKPSVQGMASPLLNVLGNASQGMRIEDILSAIRG